MATASKQVPDQPKFAKQCDPCAYDTTQQEATAFCVDCVEYLCTNCVVHHKKLKATRQHKLLTHDVTSVDKRHFATINSMLKCPKHSELDIKYKCENHNAYICVKCEGSEHAKCNKVTSIEDSNEHDNQEKDILRRYISDLQDSPNRSAKNKLEESISNIINEKARIVERRRKLVNEMENAIVQIQKKTSEFQCEVQTTVDELQTELQRVVKLCEDDEDSELYFRTVLDYGNRIQQIMSVKLIPKNRNEKIGFDNVRHFQIHDVLDPEIDKISEMLSTLGLDVTIQETKSTSTERLLFVSSDYVTDDIPTPTSHEHIENDPRAANEKEVDPQHKNKGLQPQTDKCNKDAKISVSEISTKVTTGSFSLKDKHCEAMSDEMVDQEKSQMNQVYAEVLLQGISSDTNKLDVTCTVDEVYVVTVYNARLVVLLDEKLHVAKSLKLDAKPLGVCCIERNRIAILCSDRVVRKYEIYKKKTRIYYYHEFFINKNCVCIATYVNYAIALLYNEQASKVTKGKRMNMYIEIRDHFTGCLVRTIPVNILPENVSNLSMHSPGVDQLIVSDGNVIRFFSESGKEKDVFRSVGIEAVTSDKSGNIYMFKSSQNAIVMTSKADKGIHAHYLTTKLGSVAITYSARSDRLVIFRLKSI